MAKAEKGDLIRVVKAVDTPKYSNGEIFEVVKRGGSYDHGVYVKEHNVFIYDTEYEIFRKDGEEDSPLDIVKQAVDEANEMPKRQVNGIYLRDESDAVEHPNHYTQGRFETIEVIEEITQGYSDGYVAYCVGNALKYLARAPHKHAEPAEDLRKAAKYLEFAIGRLTQK